MIVAWTGHRPDLFRDPGAARADVVWTQTRGGGTAETIDLARAAGTPVREVALEPADTARAADGPGI